MADSSQSGPNQFNALAEEFVRRFRAGERPALTDFTDRCPEMAQEIRELFPALVMMEDLGSVAGQPAPADGPMPRQLGDFRIVRPIGRGGMGIVYEAVQESLGRHVALKVLPFHAVLDPTQLERFRREARAAARLHHTNIVPVFGVGEHDGIHYYAMQYIQGQSLDEVLAEVKRLRAGQPPRPGPAEQAPTGSVAHALLSNSLPAGRPVGGEVAPARNGPAGPDAVLPAATSSGGAGDSSGLTAQTQGLYYRSVARLGVQVAEALEYAHGQGILHRDIKPSNLLLDLHGTVWVTDFGLAKTEDGGVLTQTGDIVGTVQYMAPERLDGHSEPRSDVYSLGVTLYEMLTLQPPFVDSQRARLIARIVKEEPPRPRRLDPAIPPDLETVVLKATAKEPAARYRSAGEVAEDLRRFLADRPVQARRTRWAEHAWRWCRRNPGWAATVATVTLALGVITLGSILFSLNLQTALTRAQDAERVKTDKLWEELCARARAGITSGRVGQRFESLRAIREAARIRVTPELSALASAALVLPDVELAYEWNGWPEGTRWLAFDDSSRRFARIDDRGWITIGRVTDQGEEVTMRFAAHGQPPFWGLWMSPDGRFILYGHGEISRERSRGLCVWRVDGPAPALLVDNEDGIRESAVAFRPDRAQVAVGHPDRSVSVYDLEPDGRLLHRFRLPADEAPQNLAFNPWDGRLAVACGNAVRFFDVGDPRKELPPLHHGPEVTWTSGLAWHPGGRRLATSGDDRKIHLWDVDRQAEVTAPWEGGLQGGSTLRFTATGDRLVSNDWSRQARLWDAATGRLLLTFPGYLQTFGLAQGLLQGGAQGTKITFHRLAEGRELRVLRRGGASPHEAILFPVLDESGRTLASYSFYGPNSYLSFFGLEHGDEIGSIRLPPGVVSHPVGFIPARGWVTGGPAGILCWPVGVDEGRPDVCRVGPPTVWTPGTRQYSANARFSRDGGLVVVPAGYGAVVLDQRRPGRHLLLGPQYDVRRCAVSPDGVWAVTFSHWSDGSGPGARVWRTDTGQSVHNLPIASYTTRARFSPDGRWLATCNPGIGCRLWEVGSWREVLHFDDALCAFDPLSRLLALNDQFGVIRLVEIPTGREVGRLTGPEPRWYEPHSFTPDGTRLVATSRDCAAIYIWDLRLIRNQLKELGLDWDWPEFPPANSPPAPGIGRMEILDGELTDPARMGEVERDRWALALSQNVFDPAANARLGEWLLHDGRHADALGRFSLALLVQPDHHLARLDRARAAFHLGRLALALDDLNQLLAAQPVEPEARELRARVLQRLHRPAEALADWDALAPWCPRSPEFYWERADSSAALGRAAEAEADRHKARELIRSLLTQFQARAWDLATGPPAFRDPDRALRLARLMVEQQPDHPLYLTTLGVAQYRIGQFTEAAATLARSVALSPGEADARALLFLAMCHHHLGRPTEARAGLDRALAWRARHHALNADQAAEFDQLQAEASALLNQAVASPLE